MKSFWEEIHQEDEIYQRTAVRIPWPDQHRSDGGGECGRWNRYMPIKKSFITVIIMCLVSVVFTRDFKLTMCDCKI